MLGADHAINRTLSCGVVELHVDVDAAAAPATHHGSSCSRRVVEVAPRRAEASSRDGCGGSNPSKRKGLSKNGYGLRNNASGPEIGLPGRIWAGLLPGNQLLA